MQDYALIITLIFSGFLLYAFFFVIRNSGQKVDFSEISEKGYTVRNRLFVGLLALGVIITGLTLPRTFGPIAAWAKGSDVQTINAAGYQWYWELDKDQVVVGKPVEFLISSEDVTHGFGIYDENLDLIAQAQAMPGYINRVNVTFEKTGTYKILCLEYCGLAHHDMIAEISVVDPAKIAAGSTGDGR